MQTLDAQALAIQDGHKFDYYRNISLSRRYWNGSEYVHADYFNIDDKILSCGNIKMALDIVLGEWKISNFDIVLKNNDFEFSTHISGNLFDGFIPEFSMIKVEFGYLDSGTERGLFLFTGVISRNGIEERPDGRTVKIHIQSLISLLESFSAEDLDDINETGATLTNVGDNLNYTTTETGIGKFVRVFSDGAEQDANDDYTISQLNDETLSGKITFNIAQTGKTITADYIHWYQDKTFKFLIEKLLDHAGVTDRIVQDVVFPNNVEVEIDQETEAEFDAGTLQNMHTPSGEDTLQMVIAKNMIGPSTQQADGLNRAVAQSFTMETSDTVTEIGFRTTGMPSGTVSAEVSLRADNLGEPSASKLETKNFTVPGGDNNLNIISGWSTNLTAGTTYWLVIKNIDVSSPILNIGDSNTNVYANGNQARTFDDITWIDQPNNDMVFYIKYQDQSNFMSQTLDAGVNLVSWGVLDDIKTSVGTFTFYTRTQAADSGWPVSFDENDWDEVVSNVIASSVERYIRVALVVTYAPLYNDSSNTPFINSFTVNYNASEFNIALANWTNLTVNGAIKEKALIANYEYGFRGTGQFVFKQKSSGSTPDFEMYGVTKIHTLKQDFSRVKNRVQTQFGDFGYLVDSVTQGDAPPTSIDKFGVQLLNVSGGNLLNNNSVNIAKGSAETNYNDHNRIRWFTRISGKLIPQIELGDLLRLKSEQTGTNICVFDNYVFNGFTFDNCNLPYGLVWLVFEILFKIQDIPNGGMELTLLEA